LQETSGTGVASSPTLHRNKDLLVGGVTDVVGVEYYFFSKITDAGVVDWTYGQNLGENMRVDAMAYRSQFFNDTGQEEYGYHHVGIIQGYYPATTNVFMMLTDIYFDDSWSLESTYSHQYASFDFCDIVYSTAYSSSGM